MRLSESLVTMFCLHVLRRKKQKQMMTPQRQMPRGARKAAPMGWVSDRKQLLSVMAYVLPAPTVTMATTAGRPHATRAYWGTKVRYPVKSAFGNTRALSIIDVMRKPKDHMSAVSPKYCMHADPT